MAKIVPRSRIAEAEPALGLDNLPVDGGVAHAGGGEDDLAVGESEYLA